MEQIFRWIAAWLSVILAKYADPKLQEKLDAYEAKAKARDEAAKQSAELDRQSEAALQASVSRRGELSRLIATSQAAEAGLMDTLNQSQQRIKGLENEIADIEKANEAANQSVVDRPDSERFSGVPHSTRDQSGTGKP